MKISEYLLGGELSIGDKMETESFEDMLRGDKPSDFAIPSYAKYKLV
jgi:hypothetical protein